MAVSTTAVAKTFTATAGQTIFTSTTISFIEGTADDVFEIYQNGTLLTLTTHYTLAEGSATKSIVSSLTITLVSGASLNDVILVKRNSSKIQSSSFSVGAFPASATELTFDRTLLQLQETLYEATQKLGLDSGSALSSITVPLESKNKYLKWNSGATDLENGDPIPQWSTGVLYTVNYCVIKDNALYICTTEHTSGTFSTDVLTKWTAVTGSTGSQGVQGDKGEKGDTGSTGATGAAGANGAPGADGVFSAIASEGEAKTGTDNTKGMTPLRVQQAQEALVTRISDNETDILALQNSISAIDARLYAVEGDQGDTVRANGRIRLENGATNEDLLGKDVPGLDGRGNRLELNPVGAVSAAIVCEIYRKDDSEVRFSRQTWEIHYVDGTWYIGKKSELVLGGGNPSGVTLEVTQDGDGVATVNVTADTMSGANYSSASYIKYKLLEISNQFEDY